MLKRISKKCGARVVDWIILPQDRVYLSAVVTMDEMPNFESPFDILIRTLISTRGFFLFFTISFYATHCTLRRYTL